MHITIKETQNLNLKQYLTVPISFKVESIWQLLPPSSHQLGLIFEERPVSPAFVKNYDAGIDPEKGFDWAEKWDISNWGFFGAYHGETLVGCATVAYDTEQVNMLEGRTDISVLWDIRVAPSYRGEGVGTGLFTTAAEWSKSKGVNGLKIETQNINVAACHFYAKMGCHLAAINTLAYPSLPEEIQLIWYLPF